MRREKSKSAASFSGRREFARRLITIAATPLVSHAVAGNARGSDSSGLHWGQAPQTAQAPAPGAEALTELVRIRYGKNLSEDQLKELRQNIENRVRSADRLKQVELKNGDEPSFAFTADL